MLFDVLRDHAMTYPADSKIRLLELAAVDEMELGQEVLDEISKDLPQQGEGPPARIDRYVQLATMAMPEPWTDD